jgi:hypothetical protein
MGWRKRQDHGEGAVSDSAARSRANLLEKIVRRRRGLPSLRAGGAFPARSGLNDRISPQIAAVRLVHQVLSLVVCGVAEVVEIPLPGLHVDGDQHLGVSPTRSRWTIAGTPSNARRRLRYGQRVRLRARSPGNRDVEHPIDKPAGEFRSLDLATRSPKGRPRTQGQSSGRSLNEAEVDVKSSSASPSVPSTFLLKDELPVRTDRSRWPSTTAT